MKDHPIQLLDAYHDGELDAESEQRVSRHLQACSTCRAALEGLENLSRLLAAHPPEPPPFALESALGGIQRRLPARQPTFWERTLQTGWQAIPGMIIASWLFLEAAFVLLILMQIFQGLGLWSAWLTPLPRVAAIPLNVFVLWHLGGSSLLGLLVLSWISGWWIRSRTIAANKVPLGSV